jgi:hypothetical protein
VPNDTSRPRSRTGRSARSLVGALAVMLFFGAAAAVIAPEPSSSRGKHGKVASHAHAKKARWRTTTTLVPVTVTSAASTLTLLVASTTSASTTSGSTASTTSASTTSITSTTGSTTPPTSSARPSTPAPATTARPEVTTNPPPSTEEEFGRFRVECDFSHRAQVDPIVNPGPAGTPSAHMHDFFGNTSTGSESTYSSMISAGTTCPFSPDTAGYWVPSLLDEHDEYIEPELMIVYYRNRPIEYGTTTVFPADFRMIAGGAGTHPHAYWTCDGQSDGALETRAPSPPDCGGDRVKLQVFFPSCWDGTRIDSANHRDHVAYAFDEDDGTSTDIGDDVCPASHPVKIPQLHLRVIYPEQDGASYHLSDHAPIAHADFWNTWDQAELEQAVVDCLRGGRNCDQLRD